MTSNITQERAASRYHHIQALEQQLAATERQMVVAKAHLKDLKERWEALVDRMCTAARDEGELPLFDLDAD